MSGPGKEYQGPERRRALSDVDMVAVEEAAERAASKAMRQTFRLLGVDIEQQDSINSYRADLISAHEVRKLKERGGVVAVTVIFTAICSGIVALVWDALKK